ncbi:MAG: DNA polymerase III subunit alpha, partial [Clostridia bacterium]|nr:DNA polymerase III subunit alpha [Clostridia bacterium]
LAGYIPRMIAAGDYDKAEEFALKMDRMFGRGRFYLEVQDHGLAEQVDVNRAIRDIHDKTGIPLVATNDVHYLKKSDADTQAVLMCIQTNSKITGGRPFGFETNEFYYKTTEQMEELFSDYPNAVENTCKIAQMCDFDFDFSKLYLPRFKPPTGQKPSEYLRDLTYDGLKKRLNDGDIVYTDEHPKSEYEERIEYELSVICTMGYDEYYLIVADFVNQAKAMHIQTGPGRGSGAASLVAFLIGITDVDSIRFNLMFERFLNSERVSMPDFDIDICDEQRYRVIDYVTEKYGRDHVCGITTFGTLAAKAAIRDVGRALGMSYADTDAVARAVPTDLHMTLERAMEGHLGRMYEENADVRKLIDIAKALEGMPRHASAHAAGVVITDKPVCEYVPISVNSEMMLTQYPMTTIAELGLLKFDFLGLRYLTIIDDAQKQIREKEPDFDIRHIPFDDAATYKMLSMGNTDGVFQLESAGIRRLLSQMQPRTIEDIILAIAIYRPGPMESIPKFLENRLDPDSVTYKAPQMRSILSNTSGCIIYQEQVMQICRDIAGFSFGRADIVRRAMSKKKSSEMEKERNAFIYGDKDSDGNVICHGALAAGISEQDATDIFDTMSSFAKYAFNKGHATAYAFITYHTAYLKAHYPCEYYAALLSSVLGNLGKTAVYISEAQKCRIDVLPPDINESRQKYSMAMHNGRPAIRFGLLGIKNVGVSFLNDAIAERSRGAYKSFTDFISRMSANELNKRQIEALIKSGAFDSLGTPRSMLLSQYDQVVDLYVKRSKSRDEGQLDIFTLASGAIEAPREQEFVFAQLPEISQKDKLKQEKESTGMYFSGHPTDEYSKHIKYLGAVGIGDILASFDSEQPENDYHDKDKVTIAGLVTSRVNKQTRKGDNMAFITLEDRSGEIETVVFPKLLEKVSYLLSGDSAIAVIGEISQADEETPKILANDIVPLEASFDEQTAELRQQARQLSGEADHSKKPVEHYARSISQSTASTVYVKVPSMESDELKRIMTLADIMHGNARIVVYDSSTGKYSQVKGTGINITDTVRRMITEIIGDGNLIIK